MEKSELKVLYPQLWFVCKFCKRAYQHKAKLIEHKKVHHQWSKSKVIKGRHHQKGQSHEKGLMIGRQHQENRRKGSQARKKKLEGKSSNMLSSPKLDEPIKKKLKFRSDGDLGNESVLTGSDEKSSNTLESNRSTINFNSSTKEITDIAIHPFNFNNTNKAVQKISDQIHRPSDARVRLLRLSSQQLNSAIGRTAEICTIKKAKASRTGGNATTSEEITSSHSLPEVITSIHDPHSDSSIPGVIKNSENQEFIVANISANPDGYNQIEFSSTFFSNSEVPLAEPLPSRRKSKRRIKL